LKREVSTLDSVVIRERSMAFVMCCVMDSHQDVMDLVYSDVQDKCLAANMGIMNVHPKLDTNNGIK